MPSGEVIQALVKGAKNTQMILQKPEPFVLVKSLDDFTSITKLTAIQNIQKNLRLFTRICTKA